MLVGKFMLFLMFKLITFGWRDNLEVKASAFLAVSAVLVLSTAYDWFPERHWIDSWAQNPEKVLRTAGIIHLPLLSKSVDYSLTHLQSFRTISEKKCILVAGAVAIVVGPLPCTC